MTSSSFSSSLSGSVGRTFPKMDRSRSQLSLINEFFILYIRTYPKQCQHTHGDRDTLTRTHIRTHMKVLCCLRESETKQTMDKSTESPQHYPYWWMKRIGGQSYYIWLEGRSMSGVSCLCMLWMFFHWLLERCYGFTHTSGWMDGGFFVIVEHMLKPWAKRF